MRHKKRDAQFRAAILLLAALICVLGVFIVRFHSIERKACVSRLQEYTEIYNEQISDTVASARAYLDEAAGLVYRAFQVSESQGRTALSALGDVGAVSRLELLMPDGSLYTHLGKTSDPTLSFSALADQGEQITHRSLDMQSPNHYVIRVCVPILQRNETVAILCGVIKLDRLPDLFSISSIYDGAASLHLLECDTGNYLIDAWHDTPGNLRDFDGYTFARGYSQEEYYRQIHLGEAGMTVLRTPRSTETFYASYAPTAVPNWMVMLTVPENVAFAHSSALLILFSLMAVLVLCLFLVFLLWFLRDARRRQRLSELKLKSTQYILDIQQTLFQVHDQAQRFQEVMDKIADYLSADATLYVSLEPDGSLIRHSAGGSAGIAPPRTADLRALFPQVTATVLNEGSFMSGRPFLWGEKDWQSARSMGIRNMMLVRLDTLEGGGALGMLGAINYDVLWEDTSPLDQVALVFTMAIENYRNYQTLAYLGQVDELTGLMNRNSYQTRLEELEKAQGVLSCVYVDVNGLHEINNHLGHDAGDEMLRSVANALRSVFDRPEVFRLGGDEFAVLRLDLPREELDRRMEKAQAAIEKCGYSVSVGIAQREGNASASEVVAQAEKAMRDNKADYYAHQGGERQMRLLNTHLEQTLSAKRDADILLSYLAPTFKGVYFVDPAKDTCRFIVAPPYFEQYLKDADGRFSAAMTRYAQEQVCPEDRERFIHFCQYDALLPLLKASGGQELLYRKTDGAAFLLRIREPRRAGDNLQEIMWLFTQMPSTPQ